MRHYVWQLQPMYLQLNNKEPRSPSSLISSQLKDAWLQISIRYPYKCCQELFDQFDRIS